MNNKKKIMDNLVTGILKLIDSRIRETKFNYSVYGTIQSQNEDGSYNVKINNLTYTVKTINGTTYNPGELVLIVVVNNNFSFKYIVGKVST